MHFRSLMCVFNSSMMSWLVCLVCTVPFSRKAAGISPPFPRPAVHGLDSALLSSSGSASWRFLQPGSSSPQRLPSGPLGGHWSTPNPVGDLNPSSILFLPLGFLTARHVRNWETYWWDSDPNIPAGSSWSYTHSNQSVLERRLISLNSEMLLEMIFTTIAGFSVGRISFWSNLYHLICNSMVKWTGVQVQFDILELSLLIKIHLAKQFSITYHFPTRWVFMFFREENSGFVFLYAGLSWLLPHWAAKSNRS